MAKVQIDAYLDPDTGDLPDIPRLVTGRDLIEQRILLRLNRGTGEWFLDPANVGLPLIEWKGSKPPNTSAIAQRVEAEIRAVPGVVRTSDFTAEHDPSARRVTVTGKVYLETGEVTALVAMTRDERRNSMAFGVSFSSNNIRGGAPRPSIWGP